MDNNLDIVTALENAVEEFGVENFDPCYIDMLEHWNELSEQEREALADDFDIVIRCLEEYNLRLEDF